MYKKNIAIVGGMRNVNAKVGRLIAEELEMKMLLSDDAIEYYCNSDIPSIVRDFNIEYYYAVEEEIIPTLLSCDNTVIATTGTMALNVECIEKLSEECYIVLLCADENATLRRIDNDARCFLKDEIINNRSVLFRNVDTKLRAIADITVDTTRIMPDEAKEIVIRELQGIVNND